MHNSIIQLIEAIFQMLLSIRADQQGIAQDGLGAGGTGLNNDTIRKMLMSKGTISADELVRRSTQLYDMGDQSLLVQLGIEKQYQDYKVAKLLNNSPKMWQLYQDMGKQATEYLKKVQGQGLDIMGQQMTVQQTQGVSMGMHF